MQSTCLDVVRDAGGVTYAPGCVTPDGRLSWTLMQARMACDPNRLPRLSPERQAAAPDLPMPEDYAIPELLRGSREGLVYAALLALADRGDSMPSGPDLLSLAGVAYSDAINFANELLRHLANGGWIGIEKLSPGVRRFTIAATQQVLTSVRAPSRRRAS